MKMALRCTVEKDYNILSCTQHKRFSNEDGWQLWDVSLDSSDNVVVSGYHFDGRTFVDLYCDCSNVPTLLYSKEFEVEKTGNSWRLALFIEESNVIVTCLGNNLEIIEIEQEKIVEFCKVNGDISCLCENGKKIFIGLWGSKTVMVYDEHLINVKSIVIKGVGDNDWPYSMTAFSENLFVCTYQGRALTLRVTDSQRTLQFYSGRRSKEVGASSITGEEKLKLVAVLWSGMAVNEVCIYLLTDNTCLFTIDVGSDAFTISMSEKGRLVAGKWDSGDVLMYNMRDAVRFAFYSKRWVSVISMSDCKDLIQFFNITSPHLEAILKSKRPGQFLLKHLKDKNIIFAKDVTVLVHAFMTLHMERPLSIIRRYQAICRYVELTNVYAQNEKLKKENTTLTRELKKANEKTEDCYVLLTNLRQEYLDAIATSSNLQDTLQKELALYNKELITGLEENIASEEKIKLLEAEIKEQKSQLEEEATNCKATKEELARSRLIQAREISSLKEVLANMKRQCHLDYISKEDLSTGSVKRSFSMCKQFQDSLLAAEFGRLVVDVAERLTLNQAIEIARILGLTRVDLYLIKNSVKEAPGMASLNLLKKKGIISFYDVTNLRRSLELIGVDKSIQSIVNMYQRKIHPQQRLFLGLPEGLSSEDERVVSPCDDELSPSSSFSLSEDTPEVGVSVGTSSGRLTSEMETANNFEASLSKQTCIHIHKQSIGRKGGTIILSDVAVTIPPEVFPAENDVVTLRVDQNLYDELPCQFARRRVTPVVGMEPINVNFQKPVRLKIRLNADITGQDIHGVIVYTGKKKENGIAWKKDENMIFERTRDRIEGDISATCYLYATAASYTTNSVHTIRAISFVSAILNVDEDIIITVCFCNDNTAEYQLLLSDHLSELRFGEYTTLKISHDGFGNSGTDLQLSISSLNNDYVVTSEKDLTKRISFKDMFSSRRVSHQFRLRKMCRRQGTEEVDVKLQISQDNKIMSTISLKKYVKDFLLSEDILEFLAPTRFAELTVSEGGGTLQIPNTGVILEIPKHALERDKEQYLIQMKIISHGVLNESASSFASNSSVIVELLPNNLKLKRRAKIVLPHCLRLKRGHVPRAKVYASHHQDEREPIWQEEIDARFEIKEETCDIWLDSFCWVKCEIDNEIVEAKNIKVYTAGKILLPDDHLAEIEVGYYPDLPGEGEILRLNKDLIPAQRKPFLFVKEGSHPLLVSLHSTVPDCWKEAFPDQNPKEISFDHVATSLECSHPFILQKVVDCSRGPFCMFNASQRGKEISLTIHVKMHKRSGSYSDDLPPPSSTHGIQNVPQETSLVARSHSFQRPRFISLSSGLVCTLPENNYYQRLLYPQYPLGLPLPPPMESQLFISYEMKNSLRCYLDPPATLGNDWKMLAGKLGFNVNEIALFDREQSPTCAVIDTAVQHGKLTSLAYLKLVLKRMRREDAAAILPAGEAL